MCHFDNFIKLISLDNDCMFHFIIFNVSPESNEYNS